MFLHNLLLILECLLLIVFNHDALGREIATKASFSVISGIQYAHILDVPGNSNNAVLRIPNQRFFLEARPDASLDYDILKIMLRPRGVYTWDRIEYASSLGSAPAKKTIEHSDGYLSEGFAILDLTESASLTLGRHNFQWGPAESLSPSNFIFHETVADRGVFFEAPGKDLVRLNYTPFKALSAVTLFELHENRDVNPYGAFQSFRPSALLKLELSWSGGAEYAGFTIIRHEAQLSREDSQKSSWKSRISWGEYFNVTVPFIDGLSFYGDLGHQRGSSGWYPSADPGTKIPTFSKKYLESTTLKTTSVLGIRYDFIEGEILRLEYLRDEHAYGASEKKLATQALIPTSPEDLARIRRNLEAYWNPGIDMRSPEAYFISYTVPNAFNIKGFILLARQSWEPIGSSSWFYFSSEYRIGDSGTLSYSGMLTAGAREGGLRGTRSPSHTFAYRHDW